MVDLDIKKDSPCPLADWVDWTDCIDTCEVTRSVVRQLLLRPVDAVATIAMAIGRCWNFPKRQLRKFPKKNSKWPWEPDNWTILFETSGLFTYYLTSFFGSMWKMSKTLSIKLSRFKQWVKTKRCMCHFSDHRTRFECNGFDASKFCACRSLFVVEQLWPSWTCTLVSTIPDPALILAKSTTMLCLFWHLCHCWSSPLRFFKSCFSNVVFEKINEYLVASRKIRHSISPNHSGVCCMPVENREDHIFGPTMASRLCLLSKECVVGLLFPAANSDV